MRLDLKDKRILVIMPEFYGYQAEMERELKKRGAECFIYDEEPPKVQYLILKNLKPFFRGKDLYKGFNKSLLKKIKSEVGSCDYLLIIRGNVLRPDFIEALKQDVLVEGGRCIYYTWDSLVYMNHKGSIADLFDARYSFDSVDVAANPQFGLVPLFFSDTYDVPLEKKSDSDNANNNTEGIGLEYDFASIASFSPYRYRCLQEIKKANPEYRIYAKLYFNPSVYKAKKVKEPEFYNSLDLSLIQFESFSAEEIRDIFLKSKAVLDITYEEQNGLTMRTLETLGIRKKLVTSNPLVREYDFYNDTNVYVMDHMKAGDTDDAYRLPSKEWMQAPYIYDEEIRANYSIAAWLDKLLG